MELLLLLGIPLCTAILCSFCSNERTLWQISLLGSALSFVISILLLMEGSTEKVWLPLLSHKGIAFLATPLSCLLCTLTCVMWLVSVITSREYFQHSKRKLTMYYVSLFLVQLGCIGVFLSYDWLTFFVCFELMSFASVVWVAQNRSSEGIVATFSYLAYGVMGGMSILFGLFLLSALAPDLLLTDSYPESGVHAIGMIFLFLGLGIKAGVFFLHDWLPVAHTNAPAPASGLLSGLLTKTGVFGILVMLSASSDQLFPVILFILATLTLSLGGLCALWAGNFKRVLAYSTVSQIGFLLWGVALISLLGEHNSVVVYGLILHLVTHSLVKSLLFSLAGIAYQNAGTLELEELQGFGRGKPLYHALFVVGALSLSGIPLGAAYASKSLLHEGLVEYMHMTEGAQFFQLFEWAFLLTGGVTLAYLIRLYLCLFVRSPKTEFAKTAYATPKTLVALSVVATALIAMGIFPQTIGMALGDYVAPYFHAHSLGEIHFFGFSHLKYVAVSLVVAWMITVYARAWLTKNEHAEFGELYLLKDTFQEKIYYPLMGTFSIVFGVTARLLDVIMDVLVSHAVLKWSKPLEVPDSFFHGDDNKRKRESIEFHLSSSLSYSLLMFGFGFLFTIVYLLVVGGS
ncbi:MAG: proton-conducting transporter membrane subunit [Eubacteriales bacterium]